MPRWLQHGAHVRRRVVAASDLRVVFAVGPHAHRGKPPQPLELLDVEALPAVPWAPRDVHAHQVRGADDDEEAPRQDPQRRERAAQGLDQTGQWGNAGGPNVARAARIRAIFGGLALIIMSWVWLKKRFGYKIINNLIILLILLEIILGVLNSVLRIPVPISAMHTAVAATLTGLLFFAFAKNFQIKEKI